MAEEARLLFRGAGGSGDFTLFWKNTVTQRER